MTLNECEVETEAVQVKYHGDAVITAVVQADGGPFWCCFTRSQSWSCDCGGDDGGHCCHVLATIQTIEGQS